MCARGADQAASCGRSTSPLGVMSACLRSASPEDASDVVRVLRASRSHFLPYAPRAHSEAEDLRWAIHSLIPSGGVTLASVEDRIVGVLAVSHSDGRSWIDQLYVEPQYCGRGIGTQLLRVALNSLRGPDPAIHVSEECESASLL